MGLLQRPQGLITPVSRVPRDGGISFQAYASSENGLSWCGNPPEGLGTVFTIPHWTEAAVREDGWRDEGAGPTGGGDKGGGTCRGQVTARRAASSVGLLLVAEAPWGGQGGSGPSGQRGRSHGGPERRAAQSHLARLHRARPGPQRQGLQVATQGGVPVAGASRGERDPRRGPQGGVAGKRRGGRPRASFWPSGRCAGAGALLRLPRRLQCAQRGAAGPAGRPPVRGGGEPGSLRLASGTRSRAFPEPSNPASAELGASEGACRATRILLALCEGHCF